MLLRLVLKAFMKDVVRLARRIASDLHHGQIDRDGKPHIEHCKRVASNFKDPRAHAAALLHDVLEDTECAFEELVGTFGHEIAHTVKLLTREDGQPWNAYIRQIIDNDHEPHIRGMAIAIKIADIEDNLARADARAEQKRHMYEDALLKLRNYEKI